MRLVSCDRALFSNSRYATSGAPRERWRVLTLLAAVCAALLLSQVSPAHALQTRLAVPPEASTDCAGDVPVVVASDAAAQSDIYSASTLAGALGTDCIILAGPRDQPMSRVQQERFSQSRERGLVVGGVSAVPVSKLEGRHMTRIAGRDRWETATLVGEFVRSAAVPSAKLASLSAGNAHTCGLHQDGTIECWGRDQDGLTSSEPLGEFSQVSSGYDHACALDMGTAIVCWGGNDHGQATAPSGEFLGVAAGFRYTCALRTDHAIQCWGLRSSNLTNPPTGVFASISTGTWLNACGLRPDSTAACWGAAAGVPDVPAGSFTSIAVGHRHACGVEAGSAIECWGGNEQGQSDAPGGRFTQVTAGNFHTCALRTDRTVACWGDNRHGGPTDAPTGQFVDIAAGGTHVCGIRSDGHAECWGNNSQGQYVAADAGPYVSR